MNKVKEMIKNIVFDIDRTLVDSYECEMSSLKKAIQKSVSRKFPEEIFEKLTVLPTKEFFQLLKLSPNEIKQVNKEWDIEYKKNPPKCFRGIKSLIKDLQKEYRVSILTSRTLEEFQELEEELKEIQKHFDVIVTSDQVSKPKPHPESMQKLYEEYAYVPEETVYIGDSEIDYYMARYAKCHFIQAIWDNDVVEHTCFVAKNPRDIQEIVRNIK